MAHVYYCVDRQSELTGVTMTISILLSVNCVLAKIAGWLLRSLMVSSSYRLYGQKMSPNLSTSRDKFSAIQIITPGSFPVIQCEDYQAMIVKEVWKGGIKVKPKKSDAVDLAQVKAVIKVTEKEY